MLYLCSPIGLGHVRRDLAIADALREQRPDLEVEWLTQSPVAEFLEKQGELGAPGLAAPGERVRRTSSPSRASTTCTRSQAVRRMDEVLVNNFMVFDDLVEREHFDLWVGDEAWDLDHFLHENPELKRAPFAWMTDFVGWVPMPDGGEREAFLTADYNAEMVEHVARYPSLRDRSVFVGDPDDVVDVPLGPGLPTARDVDRGALRVHRLRDGRAARPGGPRRRCAAGSATPTARWSAWSASAAPGWAATCCAGSSRRTEARRRIPGLRMVVVTGPRIDPASLDAPDGVEVHGFLPDLDLHHAACDVAVVQGGLSTTMELTASGRPFLYFPLGHHFEQQVHVRHRLERHGAGRAMDYRDADPSRIADALVEELRAADRLPAGADRRRAAARLGWWPSCI